MTALSIRNRFEYSALGLATIYSFGWLAYYMVQSEGDTAGFAALITGLFGLAIGRQLIFFPPRISLLGWWQNFSASAELIYFQGSYIYVRNWRTDDFNGEDFAKAYSKDGEYLGILCEGAGEDDFGSTYLMREDEEEVKKRFHLPWLARLRSPKLTAGCTTYKSS